MEQMKKVSTDNHNHAYVKAVIDFYTLSGHEFLDVPVIMKMLR
eukprot:gene11862-16952_t